MKCEGAINQQVNITERKGVKGEAQNEWYMGKKDSLGYISLFCMQESQVVSTPHIARSSIWIQFFAEHNISTESTRQYSMLYVVYYRRWRSFPHLQCGAVWRFSGISGLRRSSSQRLTVGQLTCSYYCIRHAALWRKQPSSSKSDLWWRYAKCIILTFVSIKTYSLPSDIGSQHKRRVKSRLINDIISLWNRSSPTFQPSCWTSRRKLFYCSVAAPRSDEHWISMS